MKDRAEITVSGKALFPLNILSKRKIRLRRVRFEESSLKFTVSGRQLGACRDSLEEFNRKYEITKKKGAGFLFEALKKRVGAIVGLVFFIVAITVYSLCVFTVDISGNEIVDTDVIAERITSETKLPLFNANIDTKKLEREIISIEGISSASVTRIGTTLKVVVLEELPRTSIEDIRTGFLPIKSKYDSVITRMFVTCGTPLVKVGQPVQKGQLLIAPYIMKDEKTTVESKAGGEVYGKVWLKKTKTFYPETIEFCRTGESFTVYDIKAFRWINSPPNPFVYSEKQTEIIYLGGIVPLRAEKSVYFETQKTVVPFDFDSCGDTLIKEGVTELEGELPEDAVKIRHWYEIKRLDKIVQLDIYYEVEIRIN